MTLAVENGPGEEGGISAVLYACAETKLKYLKGLERGSFASARARTGEPRSSDKASDYCRILLSCGNCLLRLIIEHG
jgi:hypothetical protein